MLSIKQGIVTARRKRSTLMTFLRRSLHFDRGFGSTVVETNNSSLLFPHWQRRSCPMLDSTLKLWPVDDPNTGSPTSYALMKVCVKYIFIVDPSRFDFDSTTVVSVGNTHKEHVKTASDSRRSRTWQFCSISLHLRQSIWMPGQICAELHEWCRRTLLSSVSYLKQIHLWTGIKSSVPRLLF